MCFDTKVRSWYLRIRMTRAAKKTPDLLPPTREDEPAADELAERILDAAYEQFCLLGVRRSSMEDVAKRADVGRVTIYRRFASKDKLVDALMKREVRGAIDAVSRAHSAEADVETRWVSGFVLGMRTVREHRLLLALLSTEPESILPTLTSGAGEGLSFARMYLAHEIRRSRKELGLPSTDADVIGEILARLTLSLLLTRPTCFGIDDEAGARTFAKRHIVPLVTGVPPKPR